jgi:hypothetical protein
MQWTLDQQATVLVVLACAEVFATEVAVAAWYVPVDVASGLLFLAIVFNIAFVLHMRERARRKRPVGAPLAQAA